MTVKRIATVSGRFTPTPSLDGSPDIIIHTATASGLDLLRAAADSGAQERGCVIAWEAASTVDGFELRGTTRPVQPS